MTDDVESTPEPELDRFGWRPSPALRVIGTVTGMLLLAAAVVVAVRQMRFDDLTLGNGALRNLTVLVVSTLLGLALSAEVLLRLTRRFGDVGRGEMLALVAASTLLNYLPMRPGLLGRVAWHRMVNGIATPIVARTVIEALLITVGVVAVLLLSLIVAAAVGLPWYAAALAPLLASGMLGMIGSLRAYAIPAALRHVEVLLWAVRVHAGFALVGVDLAPATALALTVAGIAASTIPLVGNGLGVREWTIGALAPVLANVDLAVGISADLIARAVEIALVVPLGIAAIAWLSRRRAVRSSPQSPSRAP